VPLSGLANPPVPLAAVVTTLNRDGEKPLMPPAKLPIVQFWFRSALKPARGVVVPALVADTVHRLMRKGSPAVALMVSPPPAASRSHWLPAEPLTPAICQL